MFTKMVPRVKTLLLEALRSDRYKQTIARMRVTKRSGESFVASHGEGHCCLGVLTECAIKDGAIPRFTVNNRSQGPTDRVRAWAGLGDEVINKLMKLNDGSPDPTQPMNLKHRKDRKNFKEIAEWIEANL